MAHGVKLKLVIFMFLATCMVPVHAQEPSPTPPQTESKNISEDDVIKIKTDLIQTGVAVFDKKGQFVSNLKLEDFDVEVNGKPISISFFEENRADRANQVSADKTSRVPIASPTAPIKTAASGRNIIFVIDDLHLSMDSHVRVRRMISKFVDQEMNLHDTVAVVSSTGKIGFLQQFTNDKAVLSAAIERLRFGGDKSAKDYAVPPMTEYEALLVDQLDPQVTDLFAAQEPGGSTLEVKREFVRGRARTILTRAAIINRAIYSTLEQAIRSSEQLSGRKVVFFISDGFILDSTNTNSPYLLQRIVDAAARTNTVIYSLDAKGLEAGFPEGTTGSSTIGFRVQSADRFVRQDGLSYLANETGGRFIKNTNDLQTGLTNSIAEATQYYLLAWQPVSETGGDEHFRKIDVHVKNHPELKVRVHRGYLDKNAKTEPVKNKNENAQSSLPISEQQLSSAATSLLPVQGLPTSLAINYLDIPNDGTTTGLAVKIDGGLVEFSVEGSKGKATIDVLGIIYNTDGKRERFFREQLTVDASASTLSKTDRQDIYYNYQTKLKPGLYQVRVATRDVGSGRIGSAVGWINIPDLTKRQLALSSLILSERVADKRIKQETTLANIGTLDLPVLVDRRFARTSELRYLIFVYNATLRATRPDVTIQTQVLRDNQVVITNQPGPIATEGQDSMRLPYAAEVSLRALPPGLYELVVTVEDRIAKSSRKERLTFEIK